MLFIDVDDPLTGDYPEAQCVVRVRTRADALQAEDPARDPGDRDVLGR